MEERADAAWGLRFPTVVGAEHILTTAPDWPQVQLQVSYLDEPNTDTSSGWSEDGCHVPLAAGGRLRTTWPYQVELDLFGKPLPECVIQPHLTSAAASVQMRCGFQPFHAGAFTIGGRTWGILGTREAGKSTTLALAAGHGADVVTDDLLVIANGVAYAGPRCVDLRPEAASELGTGTPLGVVGLRERWRIYVGPCAPTAAISGFLVPSWGEDSLAAMSPVKRLQELFSHSAMQGVTMNKPDEYLRLAALPMYAWSRPKSWKTAHESFALLLDLLKGNE